MTKSRLLAAVVLALPGFGLTGAALSQSGDVAYCQALASKYQRYVVGSSGSGKMATPNISVETAATKCNSDAARSIPVIEKALRDAQIDLPPKS